MSESPTIMRKRMTILLPEITTQFIWFQLDKYFVHNSREKESNRACKSLLGDNRLSFHQKWINLFGLIVSLNYRITIPIKTIMGPILLGGPECQI
jgi:hypothetical protein